MAQTAQLNININAQGAEKSVEQLNQSIGRAGGSAQSLRLELRRVTQELQGLEPGSARFAELSARAGQLRDQIADTAAVIQSQAGNAVERFGTALSNTVQIGVAGFQALNSVQVLFGSENEEVNKSIQKMTALLNLSQAIQTFGGLGDKITEIRAGFGLLATTQTATAAATTTATVALEGEAVAAATTAVATEGAAVATGGFALALNALPLVAIITALGFAVTALVQYSSAADDAKKEDEKRKKALEETQKAQEAETKAVVSASKDYVSLVFALKNTTAGTKERKKAIDELNNTYGTTFKNLQDEKAFQDQLNGSVKEYITLQVAKIKADINREKLTEAVKKQIDAEKAYNKALRDQKKQAEESGLTLKQVYDSFGDIATNINKTLKAYNDATAAVELYSTNSVELNKQIVDLTDNGKKYETQTIKNTGATNDAGNAGQNYSDILSKLNGLIQETTKTEQENFVRRTTLIDKTQDAEEVAYKQRLEQGRILYESLRKQIELEVTENKRKNELLKVSEDAYTKFLQTEQERRQIDIQLETFKILEEFRDRYEYLRLEHLALQKEIRFGDGNTADTLIGLEARKTQIIIDGYKAQLAEGKYTNAVQLSLFKDLQQKILDETINQQNKLKEAGISEAQAEYNRLVDLETLKNNLRKDFGVTQIVDEQGRIQVLLDIRDEFLRQVSKQSEEERKTRIAELNKFIADAKTKEEKAAAEINLSKYNQAIVLSDELVEIGKKTEENINQASINLFEERQVKILEINAETLGSIQEAQKKFNEAIIDEQIKRFDNVLTFVQNTVSTITSQIDQFTQQRFQKAQTELTDRVSLEQQAIEAQYAGALISREEYDNQIKQLDIKQQQEELVLKRKSFKTNKALNITNATIDGFRAVLSTFANTPGELIIKSIAAALAGAFAATQIALISRQQFTAADGGIVPGNGSGEYDTVPSMLAPGEAVINSDSTRAFLPLLSAINQYGGGNSFVPDLPARNQAQVFQPVFAEDKSNSQPIRAYVVENDITTSQKRINRIERSSRF